MQTTCRLQLIFVIYIKPSTNFTTPVCSWIRKKKMPKRTCGELSGDGSEDIGSTVVTTMRRMMSLKLLPLPITRARMTNEASNLRGVAYDALSRIFSVSADMGITPRTNLMRIKNNKIPILKPTNRVTEFLVVSAELSNVFKTSIKFFPLLKLASSVKMESRIENGTDI